MRLLVIRISAMGDVALTTPIISGMRQQYPDVEIVMLTRQVYEPFFSSLKGMKFFFPDLQDRHMGLSGIIRLFRDLKKQNIDRVIDLHDVLRSKILRILFRISGIPVSVIDKGRIEKRSVITGKRKVQLKHTVQRYSDVFARAGFPLEPFKGIPIIPRPESIKTAEPYINSGSEINIGVAPFAKHKLKIWPLENLIRLLQLLSENHKCRFFLFGGEEDTERIAELQKSIPGSLNVTGKFSLDEELGLISQLDLMIAMDSFNMHIAALTGIKVVSIWGGTDPLSGFGAWMQPESHSIRIPVDELTCRPCTIYGKGECGRGDFACMNWLTPELVFRKMKKLDVLPHDHDSST